MAGREIFNAYIEGSAGLTLQASFVRRQIGLVYSNGQQIFTVFKEQGIQVGEADIVSKDPFTQMFHLSIIEPPQYLGEIYVQDKS